jgi:hypothetical protein
MTLPNPDKKWDGFRLTEYFLDHKKVFALQLTEKRTENGETNDVATTLGEVYQKFLSQNAKATSFGAGVAIETDTGKLTFTGPPFNCDLLAMMLDLRQKGIVALMCRWFYYDKSYGGGTSPSSCRFFVVQDDRIVAEDIDFIDDAPGGWGFDPSVFCEADSIGTDGNSEASRREAETHYWYRRFYTETKTGQIMTLRRDHPRLYGQLPEPEPKPEVGVILLKKIHTLLWALVVIGGLLLIRFWR